VKIWLADLTYTQQTISSDIAPAAVGMIAEFVEQNLPGASVRIFKYPEDLCDALDDGLPDVLGVSNYVWNGRLSSAFLRRVKEVAPGTVTVMGGPNFPTVAHEQEAFLRAHPWIDNYIVKEGELAFLRLLECLAETGLGAVPADREVPNLCYLDDAGAFVVSPKVERVMDLTSIPSPYVSGRMDPYLDGRLLPIIQTNRGCTFCTEGQTYWNKVRRKSADTISAEIKRISQAMSALQVEERRNDLLIADSNFGMFNEDLDTCRVIAGEQAEHGYPKYINVATGKNKKERVLEAAKLVNGAMKLAGSVQSLDPGVQENIKRSNISADQIVEMALRASEIGTNTYSEIILALPGDTVDAHFASLKTLIEANFSTLSMYQLMILPGTELGLESTKERYGMETKYRVLPRCFGTYPILGEDVSVAEIEEICVSNDTLPYADYLRCRRMNLIVSVFYNDGVFRELIQLLTALGLSRWDWLYRIYEDSRSERFDGMVADFLGDTEGELWDRFADLDAFTADPEVIERYIEGEFGSNLIFRYKAVSMTERFDAVCDVALSTMRDTLREALPGRDDVLEIAEDIVAYKRCQIEALFEDQTPRDNVFRYDVAGLFQTGVSDDLEAHRLARPARVRFVLDHDQKETIDSYVRIFGNDVRGLSRILSRVFLQQLMRQPAERLTEAA